jgi:hypothetical protein
MNKKALSVKKQDIDSFGGRAATEVMRFPHSVDWEIVLETE